MDSTNPLAPQQGRSRDTAQRLLSATLRLIDEAGLDGATIPKIAALAGVAAASVYRRYADKDALIRAAFLYALAQSNQNNQTQLRGLLLKETLEDTAQQLMNLLLAQYRQHPVLFRALSHYLDTTTHREFIEEARAIMQANAQEVIAVLLHHRADIAHPDPEQALRFALFSAIGAIETFALDANALWHAYPEFSGEYVIAAQAHSFVAYLRSAPKTPASGVVQAR